MHAKISSVLKYFVQIAVLWDMLENGTRLDLKVNFVFVGFWNHNCCLNLRCFFFCLLG